MQYEGVRHLLLASVGLLAALTLTGCAEPAPDAAPAPPARRVPDVDVADLDAVRATGDRVEVVVADGAVRRVVRVDGLPVVNLMGAPDELNGLLASGESNHFEIEATVELEGRLFEGVELELHGGFARTVSKRSFRLKFPDDDKPRLTLFGPPGAPPEEHRRLVLQAAWIDPSFVRNRLTLDLARELGGLAPRLGYVVVELNGAYYGLFQAIERVDKLYLRRHGLDRAGNLYKAENHWANWAAKGDPLAGYDMQINEDNPTDDLRELLEALSFTPTTDAAFAAEVEPRLELDEVVAYQLVHTFAMDRDAYTKNYYLYHDLAAPPGTPEARFRLISWDSDATWGLEWDGTPLASDLPQMDAWHGTDAFSPRLLAVPGWRATYLERYQAALDGLLAPEALAARVVALADPIRVAAQHDLDHWSRAADFDAEVQRVIDSAATRHAVMSAVVSGLPGER